MAEQSDKGIDKNSYQFLIKHLKSHFPEQTWENTYRTIKSELQSKNCEFHSGNSGTNVNWKQILQRVCKEGLNKTTHSNEWLTILKLMEIAKSPEDFLDFGGKSVIRWRAKKGREAYLKKCKNQISFHMRLIVRNCIESSGLSIEQKLIFEDTLPKATQYIFENSSSNERNNSYRREDPEDEGYQLYDMISKKRKTDTMSQPYQTFLSEPRNEGDEDIYLEDEETNFIANPRVENQMQEEEKYNFNHTNNNQPQNYNFFQKELATSDEKDRIIDDLKRQLVEKDRNLDKKEKKIEDLERKLVEKENFIDEQNKRIISLIEEKSNIIAGMDHLTIDNDEYTNQIFKFTSSGNN